MILYWAHPNQFMCLQLFKPLTQSEGKSYKLKGTEARTKTCSWDSCVLGWLSCKQNYQKHAHLLSRGTALSLAIGPSELSGLKKGTDFAIVSVLLVEKYLLNTS